VSAAKDEEGGLKEGTGGKGGKSKLSRLLILDWNWPFREDKIGIRGHQVRTAFLQQRNPRTRRRTGIGEAAQIVVGKSGKIEAFNNLILGAQRMMVTEPDTGIRAELTLPFT